MSKHFIRPDTQNLLDMIAQANVAAASQIGAQAAREMFAGAVRLDAPEVSLPVRRDLTMPGSSGDPVPLRLYDSREDRGPTAAVLYLHGGGFTIGSLDNFAPLCSEITRALDLPVIAVDYRLAPENPWPAAPDDSEAAARWLAQSPAELGLDITGLVIAGDSAGGALTAITAQALRDKAAAVPLLCQWLLYPTVDMAGDYPSLKEFAQGFYLRTREIRWFNECYAPDPASWRASPILGNASGLAPAVIHAAGLDPLRDQGRAYAAKMVEAGVPTTYLEAPGTVHSFAIMRAALPSATADLAASIAAVKTMIGRVAR